MAKLHNGATLGAFRILHQIGEGGMAKVYKAFQPSMERYVALKILPRRRHILEFGELLLQLYMI